MFCIWNDVCTRLFTAACNRKRLETTLKRGTAMHWMEYKATKKEEDTVYWHEKYLRPILKWNTQKVENHIYRIRSPQKKNIWIYMMNTERTYKHTVKLVTSGRRSRLLDSLGFYIALIYFNHVNTEVDLSMQSSKSHVTYVPWSSSTEHYAHLKNL